MTDEEYKNEILSSIEDEELKKEVEYYLKNKKYCQDCKNYFSSYFCGYNQSMCKVYGSLDIDQSLYNPDVTADSCEHYSNKGNNSQYELVWSDIIKYPNIEMVYKGRRISSKKYRLEKIKGWLENVEN